MSKLPGGTFPLGYHGKLPGAVLQPCTSTLGSCSGVQVDFFGCRKYRTRNQEDAAGSTSLTYAQ